MSRITVGSGAPNSSVAPPPNSYPPAQYQTQRRPLISGRQPDELHIPSGSAAMGDYNRYQAPPAYGGNDGLSINVQPSTPQHLSGNAGNTLPGALQPGPMARPGPLSATLLPCRSQHYRIYRHRCSNLQYRPDQPARTTLIATQDQAQQR